MRRIDEMHLEHPCLAARMLRRQLQCMGIQATCRQPGTSKRQPHHEAYPYLLRKVTIYRANQVWALDTIYKPMKRGFIYPTAAVDVASRTLLAHKVANTLEAWHAREVIEQAFPALGCPRSSTPTTAATSRPRSSPMRSGCGAPCSRGDAV